MFFLATLQTQNYDYMHTEEIETIGFEDFKKHPLFIQYMDNDIAILNNLTQMIENGNKTIRFDCFMIIFNEGYENIRCNINGRDYVVKKDYCAILPTGTIINSYRTSADNTVKIATVSKKFLSEIICVNKETLNVVHYLHDHPVHPIGRNISYKLYLYKELMLTLINEEPHVYSKQTRRFHFAGLFCEMLARLSSIVPEENRIENSSGRSTSIVHDFIDAVNADNGTHRSVAYFADLLCYSPKYLSYSVKVVTGRTPSQIINAHVVSCIKYNLKHTNMSMKRMADHFNFPNPSFFGKFFKAHTGISPMQFRETEEKEQNSIL